MNKEQAFKTAVQWWADKLKKRQPHSNGDSGLSSVFACLLADMQTSNITDDQLDQFRANLEASLENYVNQRYILLCCDYGPCVMLADAAKLAGINLLNFPFKTDLVIEEKTPGNFVVRVSEGYAQPYVEVRCTEDV